MRILYYFADNKTYMSIWQYEHIVDELRHHNVRIDIFNPLDYSDYDMANQVLLKKLQSFEKYDLFMNCCPSWQLYKTTICEISRLSIPTLLICFDNLHAAYIHKEIMPYFDLVWLTSWENEATIKKWGVNTLFMPYAANPYKFVANIKNDIERVCFIGTPYGTRTVKINKLTENDIPVDVYYGSKNLEEQTNSKKSHKKSFWDSINIGTLYNHINNNIGRKIIYSRFLAIFNETRLNTSNASYRRGYSLPFDDMVQSYSDYALSLNVLELRNTYLLRSPVYKLHLRTFEIPMCGGIEFTTYNDELSNYFEEDKEIVFYHSEEEYIDKARFYLKPENYAIRERIKRAARKRAEQEHTWWCRFEKIFQTLNLKY